MVLVLALESFNSNTRTVAFKIVTGIRMRKRQIRLKLRKLIGLSLGLISVVVLAVKIVTLLFSPTIATMKSIFSTEEPASA